MRKQKWATRWTSSTSFEGAERRPHRTAAPRAARRPGGVDGKSKRRGWVCFRRLYGKDCLDLKGASSHAAGTPLSPSSPRRPSRPAGHCVTGSRADPIRHAAGALRQIADDLEGSIGAQPRPYGRFGVSIPPRPADDD